MSVFISSSSKYISSYSCLIISPLTATQVSNGSCDRSSSLTRTMGAVVSRAVTFRIANSPFLQCGTTTPRVQREAERDLCVCRHTMA